MRKKKDYNEIITEAGRRKYHIKKGRKNWKNTDKDGEYDTTEKETIRPYSLGRCEKRELLDKLGALRRMLESNVGRPWNKVWSILSQIGNKTVAGLHVKSHINTWVVRYPVWENGKPHYPQTIFLSRQIEFHHDQLYVDPYGILKKYKNVGSRRYQRPVDPYTKVVSKENIYITESGSMYRHMAIPPDKIIESNKYLYRPEDSRGPWRFVLCDESEKKSGYEYIKGPFTAVYELEKAPGRKK